jgi:hypothetical protein
LPYIEQGNVREIGRGLTGGARQTALGEQRATVIALFHCPSRRAATGYPAVGEAINAGQPELLAKTDYAANGGSNLITGPGPTESCLGTYPNCQWDHSDEVLFAGHTDPQTGEWVRPLFDGVSGERSEISSANVLDGTTCTILVAEKYMDPDCYESGACPADDSSLYQGNDYDANRWVPGFDNKGQVTHWAARFPMQDISDSTQSTPIAQERFGSVHTVGFHVALCDGSVHNLNFGIDQVVYARLGIRNDGTKDCDIVSK